MNTRRNIARGAATALLAIGGLTAASEAPAQAAKSPTPGWPTSCNSFLEYGQFLYFYSCAPGYSKNVGAVVELLTYGSSWRAICIQDNFIAKWDRGGYAGHRRGGTTLSASYCNWAASSPSRRQPGS